MAPSKHKDMHDKRVCTTVESYNGVHELNDQYMLFDLGGYVGAVNSVIYYIFLHASAYCHATYIHVGFHSAYTAIHVGLDSAHVGLHISDKHVQN